MKLLEAKNLKLLYYDGVCRFYSVGEDKTKKPIVFINGQMEHHIQALETFTNITKSSCFQYSHHYKYAENVHCPYIFVYDYPIYSGYNERYNTMLFTVSLCQALKSCKLENVDIMGISLGGIIAIRSSVDSRVDKSIAIHPPILSSPFANVVNLEKNAINMKRKLYLQIMRFLVNNSFGFQKENARGYSTLENISDLSKVTIAGSSIYGIKNNNSLENDLSNWVYEITGMENDGIVCWDEKKLQSRGFKIFKDQTPTSHFALSNKNDYTESLYRKLVLK